MLMSSPLQAELRDQGLGVSQDRLVVIAQVLEQNDIFCIADLDSCKTLMRDANLVLELSDEELFALQRVVDAATVAGRCKCFRGCTGAPVAPKAHVVSTPAVSLMA